MRVCVMVLGFILAAGTSTAMAQQYTTGVKVGVNFAKLNFEVDDADDDDFNDQLDSRTGLVGGVFVLWPMSSNFGIQTEALYSQKGATFEEEGDSGAIKIDYFEVPVLARFSSTPSMNGSAFNVFAGPSFGFRLRARSESEFEDEEESEDITDDVERFDLGLVLGAGVEFGRLLVDGRYTWGLSNLNAVDNDDVKIKNRAFSIMAGFKF